MATEPTFQNFAPRLRSQQPKCPRCGGIVFLADRSRFDLAGRIQHVWCCNDCCNEFVTSIGLVHPCRSEAGPNHPSVELPLYKLKITHCVYG
jgi:ribosomal protein S27AE